MRNALLVVLVLLLGGLNLYQYFRARPVPVPETSGKSNPSDQEVIERFHRIFYERESTWSVNKWLGVETLQNPNDVWIIQEILSEIRPDFVIETGTRYGGSAALWAMILEQVNPRGRVISIDIRDSVVDEVKNLPVVRERVEFLVGSSTAPDILARVAERVQGRKVVVILDSDHRKNHVAQELRLYSPLVSVGSYLVVQDTNVNGHPVLEKFGPGPWEAVEEFLAERDDFEADRTRERFLFTMHPRGYLKRIR